LAQVNDILSKSDVQGGKPEMIAVKSPPIIPALYQPAFTPTTFSLLPVRSTRASLPSHGSQKTSIGGKIAPSEGGKKQPRTIETAAAPPSTIKQSEPSVIPTVTPKPATVPTVRPNKEKVYTAIREAFDIIAMDVDYGSLQDEYLPEGIFPAPPMSLTLVKERVDSDSYEDHFQFMDDLVTISNYWLQGPPQPNPMLPQYMAALKLIRNGTDIMMSSLIGKVANDDYYSGPNVEAAIREEIRFEQETAKSKTSSPSFARKVKKPNTDSSISATTGRSSSGKNEQLKNIEQQVTMLTQHVLGLHKTTPRASAGGSATVAENSRPLGPDEIQKLETDLLTLSPEDIDHIITTLLKDEPSVRVDDESYELDVGALPPVKQRNLRRFVTRKLNIRDPAHGAQKLKQMLRDDDLARASEEMAERLLAASSMPSPAGPMMMGTFGAPPAVETVQMSPEEVEAERQRLERERQREEEAKRLWRLAHGDDDEDME